MNFIDDDSMAYGLPEEPLSESVLMRIGWYKVVSTVVYSARCPSCRNDEWTFRMTEHPDGETLLCCLAGCETWKILEALVGIDPNNAELPPRDLPGDVPW